MSYRYEIRLAGMGGQGLLLGGLILAEAAAVHAGKNAVQTQAYAPLARGAPSKSDIIISDGEIDFPKVEKPDLFLAMAQDSYNKYHDSVKEGGHVIVDSTNVKDDDENAIRLPLTQIARDTTGKEITATIVALGVIARLTSIVSREDLLKAVEDKAPAGTAKTNIKALEAGFDCVGTLPSIEISPGLK
jgi:2-oxoglutarate ferredoxin oxidoreductase subunit gamma